MAKFEPAIEKILELEGGFVDHPSDPGGATNFGISLRWLQTVGDYDRDDIKDMTAAQASALYKEHWWDKHRYENIPDQLIANKLFDMSVNMGPKQAHRLLQRAMNSVLGKRTLKDDGILGPKTLQTLIMSAAAQPHALLSALRAHQEGFYRLLVAQKPSFQVFLEGWINRAVS